MQDLQRCSAGTSILGTPKRTRGPNNEFEICTGVIDNDQQHRQREPDETSKQILDDRLHLYNFQHDGQQRPRQVVHLVSVLPRFHCLR